MNPEGGGEKSPAVKAPAAVKINGGNAEGGDGGGGMKGEAESTAVGGGLKKGPWTAAEDAILVDYVKKHGEGNWNSVQRNTGLARCGKSCRLRWANHLRPNLKKGSFSPDEELLILRLHAQLGNKWARMASLLPGRTDNEIKNYWNTRMKRRQRAGLPVYSLDVPKPAGFGQRSPTSPRTPPPPTAFAPAKAKYTAERPPPLLDFFSFGAPSLSMPTTSPTLSPLGPRPIYNPVNFQFPLSPSPVTPPPTPNSYFQQPPPPLPMATMQFILENYDVGTSPLPVKLELPSSQFYPELVSFDYGGSNAGLLDTLLHDAPPSTSDELKFAEFLAAPAGGGKESGDGIETPSLSDVVESAMKYESLDFDMGIKMMNATAMAINDCDMCDDMSTLFDISAPAVTLGLEWYGDGDSVGGEISKGQQAAARDDGSGGGGGGGGGGEAGLEMNDLASSFSITNVDQDWNINSCSWNNLPEIC